MSIVDEGEDIFQQEDHQGCYIFRPADEPTRQERPSKRRKVSKAQAQTQRPEALGDAAPLAFVPLLNGLEGPEGVAARERLFKESWSHIDVQVQKILRESNQATLDQVSTFMRDARPESDERIPSAFIFTGPNIASQDLLFQQLSESLQSASRSRFVRLRSADAGNLKTALKKIIRDVEARTSDDEDDVATGRDGRKYLDYDLAGLHAFIQPLECEHIYIAFQDSEAFDSGLLSDLIQLFSSWRSRIPFALLFGVATSVELLQARLLRAAIPRIYGAQFDVAQSSTILEKIFKRAVAASDVSLRLGPMLLQSLVDRQRDHMAGIPEFISSVKYAYMCHFYANPLSTLLEAGAAAPQPEHIEAVRSLPSFRGHVEGLIESGKTQMARSLLEDDESIVEVLADASEAKRQWILKLLQCLRVLELTSALSGEYSHHYTSAIAEGISLEAENNIIIKAIHRMLPDELVSLIDRLLVAVQGGDPSVVLPGFAEESDLFASELARLQKEAKDVKAKADQKGHTLRSAHSAQNKVLRTTVVAQKVQLSHDSATLTDEDKEFTAVVDRVARELTAFVRCEPATSVLWHEVWLYDSRAPYRDVFIPRPRAVIDRSLLRPHDYLACSCCSRANGAVSSTLPPTSILYHLYLETGSLVNVADLWTAFFALVGDENKPKGKGGYDERTALVLFYQGLADLRTLGFVKASRKKEDHVAKLKWL